MLVKMRTTYASPKHGTCEPDKCIDLPTKEAKALIAAGVATEPKAKRRRVAEPEAGDDDWTKEPPDEYFKTTAKRSSKPGPQ